MLGIFGLSSLVSNRAKAGPDEELGKFYHHVFFWLKDQNEATLKKFRKGLEFLGSIETINHLHIGRPAPTKRDVIDNSYDYSFLVTFNSKKEHDVYQEHPDHKKFIEDYDHLWEKVLVYDSIE